MAKQTKTPFRRSPLRSEGKVRTLTAKDLNVAGGAPGSGDRVSPDDQSLASKITTQHSLHQDVVQLLRDGYAGVIFSGPPGTSKSWFAHNIGLLLADNDPERFRSLQFHPSYQYEDFVEGYAPRPGGQGFRLRRKHLLEMCEVARQAGNALCVIVIDELSRADPGRVFGESLTYIEMSKRGLLFRLASGRETSIPSNLVFLATMNALDRGVDEIDIAFERRFARIEMPPDDSILEKLLTNGGMPEPLQRKVREFFNKLKEHPNPYCRIGHAYFSGASTRDDLQRLWKHQLKFTLEKACRLQPDTFKVIEEWWADCVRPLDVADAPAGSI